MNRLISLRSYFSSKAHREHGFTLIEVLVAISLLAIVLTSVYGLFTSVSSARERLDADSAEYHRARVVFDRLGREIRGAYFQTNNPDLTFSGGLNNSGYWELELTTTAVSPLIQKGSGIARVHYQLIEDPEDETGGMVLMRSEQPVHQSARDADSAGMMRLSPGIETMTIRFSVNDRWQEQWDARTDGLPDLVEIALLMRRAGQVSTRFISAFEIPSVEAR